MCFVYPRVRGCMCVRVCARCQHVLICTVMNNIFNAAPETNWRFTFLACLALLSKGFCVFQMSAFMYLSSVCGQNKHCALEYNVSTALAVCFADECKHAHRD